MRVLLTKPFFKQDLEYLKNRILPEVELIIPTDFSEENLSKLSKDVVVLLGPVFTDKILSEAKNLKLIQIPWTGVDNLNYELLSKYNVTIANSHSNSGVVAEHALSLMFDAAKRISYHDKEMRNGNWNRPNSDGSNPVSPFSLKIQNAKVSIIGFGAIGKEIYNYLKSFDCDFTVFNRTGVLSENFKDLKCYSIDKLDKEISSAEIIFTAIALTDKTRGLLGEDFFKSVNKNAVFINVSRGEIVNERYLYLALKENSTFFAAIDTWYKYPSKDHPNVFPSANFDFQNLNNLVLSPHRAGMIQDSLPHLDDAIDNLNRLVKGKELINIISIENKY